MLNRRHLLLASVAAGVTMSSRTVLATAAQPSTPVNFDVPAGAVDTHTHIHGDPAKFPFFAGRVPTRRSPHRRKRWRRCTRRCISSAW